MKTVHSASVSYPEVRVRVGVGVRVRVGVRVKLRARVGMRVRVRVRWGFHRRGCRTLDEMRQVRMTQLG